MPISIIGLIVMVFSVATFFLLDVERVAVNTWALVFLLLSELVLFGGMIALRFSGANYSRFFQKTGITTTLTLYFVVTLISVFFAGSFRGSINVFILIELAIIAFFAIILISFIAFSHKLERQSSEDTKKVGVNEPKRGGF